MRNLLTLFAEFSRMLFGQLDGFVHPSAADDPWAKPRHKAFLASCFLNGAIALVVLPLHLALAGPTSLPMALLLAFLIGQWPLALYLTQSGDLERAYGLSSALFAAFLTGLCMLTGGLSSFALVWFAVVPMEAALSGTRRIILAVCALCAVLIAALAVLPSVPQELTTDSRTAMLLSSLAACVYMTVLALRLALEQRRARHMLGEGERRWSRLNASTAEVACRCQEDGSVTLLGGPLENLLGLSARQVRGDWLFQRLHVADRPAYLAALAEARSDAAPVRLELRLRKGSNLPGEEGIAEYADVTALLRKPDAAGNGQASAGFDGNDLVLTLAEKARAVMPAEGTPEPGHALSSDVFEKPLAEIVSYADLLCQSADARTNWAQQREYAELIHRSGLEILQAVQNRDGAARVEDGEQSLVIEPVDLESILENCRAMLAPVAANGDVTLDLSGDFDIPRIPADRRALRQIALDLLSHAVDLARPGGSVLISGRRQDKGVLVDVMVLQQDAEHAYGPQSHLVTGPRKADTEAHSAEGLEDLTVASGLIALHNGNLECQTLSDDDRLFSIWLPAGASKAAAPELPVIDNDRRAAGGSWR